jgi:hypothetical protein
MGCRAIVYLLLAACGGSGMADVEPDGSADGTVAVDAAGEPTAAQLLGAIATCNDVAGGPFATDEGGTANISICGLSTAVFWEADMDIDCDGKSTTVCNSTTDPSFGNQTSATDSHGDPLDAAALPYVVIPLPSSRFNYATAGLALGSVIAVIYNDHVEYGIFGDEGPSSIIGEASHRMAELLGIDPDPATGGVDSGVAYIAFTGTDAVVSVIEDHDEAVRVGVAHAKALIAP